MMMLMSFGFMFLCWFSLSLEGLLMIICWILIVLLYLYSPMLGLDKLILSNSLEVSMLSWSLTILTLFICIWMLICSMGMTNKSFSLMMKWHIMMAVVLMLAFSVNSLLNFYVFFELSLIPILVLIFGWGYQPERLTAGFYMLMYTIFASLPLLMLILYWKTLFQSGKFLILSFDTFSFISKSSLTILISFMLLTGFLVKVPLFGLHIWLPKAHVEAPVSGSMILAGLLLKLGGYGFFQMSGCCSMLNLEKLVQMYSIMGGMIISVLCIRQMDVKVLIAYSSVSHMSLVICTMLMNSEISVMGGVLMMISHGLVSSGLFLGANVLYEFGHSRNLGLNLSLLSYIPSFSMFWFCLCMGNMGGPFTLNLVSEIICFISIISMENLMILVLSILSLFAVIYSVILYFMTQQGEKSSVSSLSSVVILRDLISMFNHTVYVLMMVIASEMFML